MSASISRSGQRSGLMTSMQIRDGSAFIRATTGQVVRTVRLDVERRTRVEVDEQHLALGQQRQADLERRGAGAVVEGEERVVRLGGGQQLAAADLDGAEPAAHQRLAAVGAAGGQLDDRLEVRLHLPVREELGEPVGARAVEQLLGRQRQRLLVGQAQREQARALGGETALSSSFRRSFQPGPASTRPSTAMSPSTGSVARCSTL